jgi:TrmH family RNA methyltransferase
LGASLYPLITRLFRRDYQKLGEVQKLFIQYGQDMETISSRANSKIKSVRALRQRKQRESSGLFLVEGIHHMGAAVEAGATIEEVYYAPDLLKSQYALDMVENVSGAGVPSFPVTAEVFNSLAEKENPQGILAVVRQRQEEIEDLNPENFAWGVVCIAPQDPGNVGTILRTIDAVGASGLLLLKGGVDPYHPTAVRASMGAIIRYPVVRASFNDFSDWVEGHNYQVYGTSTHGEIDYQQINSYARPAILLLGDERQGLTPEQEQICRDIVRLPMRGQVSSLNLAVAAGVMLYAMLEKLEN